MNYSQEIISAHEAWGKALDSIPDNEHEKGYKSRVAKARRLWNIFSSLCEKEGLKALEVALSFLPKTLKA